MPLISTNWKDGRSSFSAACWRHRITSWTVAVLPVPGTPEMYMHLQKEKTPPFQQPAQNGNTLGINEPEFLGSETSLKYYSSVTSGNSLYFSYFICKLGHRTHRRIVRTFITTKAINNLTYIINVIYLFFFLKKKRFPRYLKFTSYILVFNLNLYNKGAHIISMHNLS